MSDDPNPRAVLGANRPPLFGPDELPKQLDLAHADLFAEAAGLDAERFALPEAPATDAECAAVSAFILKARAFGRKVEGVRAEVGRPYLDSTKAINAFFKEIAEPVDAMADPKGALANVVNVYARAKAERERAERLERERQERATAEAARKEEQRLRDEAEAAQRRSEEAAAAIRAAADKESRDAAEKAMREADAQAASLRKGAEDTAQDAAQAERKAETNARQAAGPVAALSRVGGGGATSSITKRWSYEITAFSALQRSLGPLGQYLSLDTIEQAVARAVREQSQGGQRPTLDLPGVILKSVDRTNIRAAQ